ncbi:hypothetical protein ACHAPA_010482 [Fusarium lateritium]
MGFITGETDSQRKFNGMYLDDLCAESSRRVHWIPQDRVKMQQWLATSKTSIASLRSNQESLARLASSLGIAHSLSHKHRLVLKKKLLSSLDYTIRSFLNDGRVTEFKCLDTGAKTLRWPQDLLDEVLGGGRVEVGGDDREREVVVVVEEEEEEEE